MHVLFGPSGREESWLVRAASLTSFACRRSEYFGGAQQPVMADFVGSNRDTICVGGDEESLVEGKEVERL